jgi:hypothetical protein
VVRAEHYDFTTEAQRIRFCNSIAHTIQRKAILRQAWTAINPVTTYDISKNRRQFSFTPESELA